MQCLKVNLFFGFQFAEEMIMSPVNGRSDVELGQLLNVISDPFSARKQLCRTPESLSISLLMMSTH